MFLTSTKTITVTVDAAATVRESDITAHYVDYAATDTTPNSADIVTNGTSAVTAVAAPGAGVTRHLQHMSIYNADSVAHAYTVAMTSGANVRKVVTMRLAPLQAIQYVKGAGWQFVPESDPQHQEQSATVTGQNQWTTAMLVQAGDAVSVSIMGSGWSAAVYVQRMLDGANWQNLQLPSGLNNATAPIELTYIADETGYLRVGVPTGMFVSGTIPVRIGVH